jgi:hypothetical protein
VKPPKRPSPALQPALFPHETDQRAPRAAEGPNFSALGPEVRRPKGGHPGPPPRPTKHFTANTCRKCGAITIAGTTYGIRIDLEPHVLDDLTEYQAIRDNVPTYDLWPDRQARRRHLEEIAHPERVPRHARHTCGTTYGTQPRPTPPATSQPDPTGPAPF